MTGIHWKLFNFVPGQIQLTLSYNGQTAMITSPPKYKAGDTIYWYCCHDNCVHHANVLFVNVAKVGQHYLEVNYEVQTECQGETRTLFIDDYDAMEKDL